jgi:YbgC/YbaW family acyl-CoA thioester hydrolase
MKRSDFQLLDRLRVRWAEVDMQRIVFNGHYLTYVDTAMGAYWRAMALPYEQTMQMLGGDLFVRKATLDYLGAALYDDALEVGIRNTRIGNSSLGFEAGVFRGEDLLVSAELVYVFADAVARSPLPVPPALRQIMAGFEAGEPMVTVKVGGWAELGAQAGSIRTEVFVDEQRIPAEMEWDAADAQCVHAVAYNRLGVALGTGRLLEHVPGVAKIGRMAVRRAVRGGRVGRAVLEGLLSAAQARGDREALLHAQTSAAGFYLRAGFVPRGPAFEEAGIMHIEMVKAL